MKITKHLFVLASLVSLLTLCTLALDKDVIIDTGPLWGEQPVQTQNIGDINLDGMLDKADISLLAKCLAAEGEGFTTEQLLAANLYTDDNEGTIAHINIKDLIALAQYVNRLESVFEPQGILSNLAIPIEDENGDVYKSSHNSVDGVFVHVLTDGEILWIQLDEEAQAGIYPSIEDAGEFEQSYLGKLCSAVQLLNGKYQLTSLAYNELEDGTYAGLNNDEDKLVDTRYDEILYAENGIKKITFSDGEASCFRDYTPTSLCKYNFTLTDDTIIIVKSIKNKGTSNETVEYIHYSKNVFSYEYPTLYNASIILQNNPANPSNTTENALVIYAEAEDYTTRNERVVSSSDVNIDQDGSYRNYYTVLNPYSGTKKVIPGSVSGDSAAEIGSGAFPTGTLVQVKSDAIYENEGYDEEDVINPDTDLVWLIDYDIEAKTITVLPETSTDESDAVTYTYTDNTCLSILKHMNKSDLLMWGTMNSVDPEYFYSNIIKNDYKCYNENVLVGNTYKTRYAKYVKAYAAPIENTNVLDYAIVIVHGNEAIENLNV